MANKGEIRIDGKVMGKDYGRYFYSPRGNMWAVTLCTYDCDDGRMFEKIELYRTKDQAREAAFRLNTEERMGKTDVSVIKLPEGCSLKKIDERTYELVKIDDFKKGDFLFAKSRTGHVKDYVFINNGGLKANFLYEDKNTLICNSEFNFSNNYDISKATLEQIAAMRRLLSENHFTIVDGEVVPITDPVVGFVIVNDVIYPASKIYRSRECAMYDLKRKIKK